MAAPVRKGTDPKKSRPSHRSTHDRVTITLPRATMQRVRQRAADSGAPSLSAYISRRLDESERELTFMEYLDELFHAQPITDEEQRWADSLLGL
ncbi:MAG: hypothetical protein EPO21_15685 [Chloroflexota bacterium]|nr:MAG: hypothetical protein EPO21_15685 [Chloroflexota bacterium]